MNAIKKLGIIGGIVLGAALAQVLLKGTPADSWLQKHQGQMQQAFQNALTLPPDQFSWAKGNRNPFSLLWQDTMETSLLTGTDGYGPWIETPLFDARLISALAGTRTENLYTAVQLIPKPHVSFTDFSVSAATLPPAPVQVVYPFSPTHHFPGPVLIPIFITPSPQSDLKLDADITVSACKDGACLQTQVPVSLTLLDQNAFPTPIYAKMMYDAGIFPKTFPNSWTKSLSAHGVLTLTTDTPIQRIKLYAPDSEMTVTPLALFSREARFFIWPLPEKRIPLTVEVNRHYYTFTVRPDRTLPPLSFPAAAHLKSPPTPYTILFLASNSKSLIPRALAQLSSTIRQKLHTKELRLITLPNAGPVKAFIFGPKIPLGLEVSPFLSPFQWSKLLKFIQE